jgi:hypothetical protein
MNNQPARRLEQRPLGDLVMNLSPAYFAMVMATGIVSLSAHMLGMPRLADGAVRTEPRGLRGDLAAEPPSDPLVPLVWCSAI